MGNSLAEARAALARGDVLVAFDHASSALAEDPTDVDAQYVAALSLARAGAADRAERAAEALRAQLEQMPGVAPSLREDADALLARLAKDRALRTEPAQRAARLADAARRYAAVADAYRSHYAAVNAATLWLLADDRARASECARRARDLASVGASAGDARAQDDYWRTATVAEAALVLGDVAAARAALTDAVDLAAGDAAALAATRRQLQLVCTANSVDRTVLDVIAAPAVLHFCGTRSVPPDHERAVRSAVRDYVEKRRAGVGFGSLASGADILVAEVMLDAGCEVGVVLPFDADEFERISVAPAGDAWVPRFRECLERASSVSYASDSEYLHDDELFGHASRIAMGHALNRARFLDAEVEQLAIWDGTDDGAPAGTARDVEQWRALGRSTHVIPLPPGPTSTARPPARPSARSVRGILFADFRGFSRLRDEHFTIFVDTVMGALADVLARSADAVLWRNTWGDAVQAICRDVVTTAACALGFQEAIAQIDLAATGLPADLHLRIGAHVGPVIAATDHVLGDRATFVGRELTRAARIEPLTPTGEVYVTDAFAAVLAVEGGGAYATEYVGRITTAKNFETIPMHRLHRAGPPASSQGTA